MKYSEILLIRIRLFFLLCFYICNYYILCIFPSPKSFSNICCLSEYTTCTAEARDKNAFNFKKTKIHPYFTENVLSQVRVSPVNTELN